MWSRLLTRRIAAVSVMKHAMLVVVHGGRLALTVDALAVPRGCRIKPSAKTWPALAVMVAEGAYLKSLLCRHCHMEPTGIEPVTSCLQSRRSPI